MEPEQWEEYKPYALSALQRGTYALPIETVSYLVQTASNFVAFVDALIIGDKVYRLFFDSLSDELLFLWQLSQ